MKYIIIISPYLLILLLACSQKHEKNVYSNDEQIISMLKEFYSQYIIESEKGLDQKKIEAIQSRYSTVYFINKIRNEELDAEPYINGQDFNTDWVNTLSVIKVENGNDRFYRVCYVVTYDKSIHCVNVFVKKENELWKINDVSW